MIQKYGINGMWRRVSETARYGGLTRGPMVMTSETKDRMKKVLDMIQDGTFNDCLLYTSPSPRDLSTSRMPSSA